MGTIRVSHQKNYTCIHNDAIRDNRLSLKARGLHHVLLSYPDGWVINIEHLSGNDISEKDGRTAIASALNELEEKGYLRRLQTKDELGRITGWEQVLHELPPADFQVFCKSGKPKIGKSSAGFSSSGKPDMILNTDSTSTELKEVPSEKIPRTHEDHTHKEQPRQVIEVEVVEDFSSTQAPIQNSLCLNKSFHESKSSLISFNKTEQTDNEKIANRCRRQWEESGYIPKIPVEFEAWASIDLGNDVINIYRKSGRLTTIRAGDIDSRFAMYVAGQYKGKDVDYGYQRIKKLEREPENWETLRALVLKWKASMESGRPNLNVTEEVQAHERKQTKRVRETFDW